MIHLAKTCYSSLTCMQRLRIITEVTLLCIRRRKRFNLLIRTACLLKRTALKM